LVDPAVAKNKDLTGQVELVLAKKAAGRPITSEDYQHLNRLVAGVEGRIVDARAVEYEKVQQTRAEARQTVPAQAWEVQIEELELSPRVESLLLEQRVTKLGDLLMYMEMGDDALLDISGFGAKALEEVQQAVDDYELEVIIEEPVEELEEEPAEVKHEVEDDQAVSEEELLEEPEEEKEELEAIVAEESEVEDEAIAELVEEPEEEQEPDIPAIDDLATPLVAVKRPAKKEKKKVVVVKTPTSLEAQEEEARSHQRGKQLEFNEQLGKVVVKRKRKSSRRRPEWEDIDDIDELEVDIDTDVDEILEDEI